MASFTHLEDLESALPHAYDRIPENHIRLLTVQNRDDDIVQCEMETVNLKTNPTYNALSYTWGDPHPASLQNPDQEPAEHTIFLNGQSKTVTENLYRALLRLSHGCPATSSIPIWIDALCVNQDDNREKATQVQRMDEIYKGASTVIAWLGEADEFTLPALEAVRYLAAIDREVAEEDYVNHRQRDLGSYGLSDRQFEALIALFCRAWFTRVWVIQEVTFARQLVVVWGSEVIPPDIINGAASYLVKATLWFKLTRYVFQFSRDPRQPQNRQVPALGAVIGSLAGMDAATAQGRLHPKILTMFGRGCKATDPRDHIYAMLGLAKDAIAKTGNEVVLPEVSYDESVLDVFVRWAEFMIEEMDNYILFSLVEDKSHRKITSLPSWIPDLSTTMMPNMLRSQSNQQQWSPSGELKEGHLLFNRDSATVRTPAARVDFVVAVSTPFDLLSETHAYASILDFIEPLFESEEPYPNPLEALARTMTGGDSLEASESNSATVSMLRWILTKISASAVQGQNQSSAIPLLLRINGRNQAVASILRNLFARSNDAEMKESLRWFETRSARVRNTRRLILTSKNYLGIAAQSTAEGDEVWIFPGAATPFVLREAEYDSYTLMGEAYVHGIMNGEAVAVIGDDALLWDEIEIS